MNYTALMELAKKEIIRTYIIEIGIMLLIIAVIVIAAVLRFRAQKKNAPEPSKPLRFWSMGRVFLAVIGVLLVGWSVIEGVQLVTKVDHDIEQSAFVEYEGRIDLNDGKFDETNGRPLVLSEDEIEVRIYEFDERWDEIIYFSEEPPEQARVVYGADSKVVIVFEAN